MRPRWRATPPQDVPAWVVNVMEKFQWWEEAQPGIETHVQSAWEAWRRSGNWLSCCCSPLLNCFYRETASTGYRMCCQVAYQLFLKHTDYSCYAGP